MGTLPHHSSSSLLKTLTDVLPVGIVEWEQALGYSQYSFLTANAQASRST